MTLAEQMWGNVLKRFFNQERLDDATAAEVRKVLDVYHTKPHCCEVGGFIIRRDSTSLELKIARLDHLKEVDFIVSALERGEPTDIEELYNEMQSVYRVCVASCGQDSEYTKLIGTTVEWLGQFRGRKCTLPDTLFALCKHNFEMCFSYTYNDLVRSNGFAVFHTHPGQEPSRGDVIMNQQDHISDLVISNHPFDDPYYVKIYSVNLGSFEKLYEGSVR
jgi:proteasome lid subunit RPN8/RPN11